MTLRILLADDNLTAQNTGKKILAAAGYDVVTVSNGVAAVHKTAELRPDIVLLDVYMPGYSGMELCRQMKAAPETAGMPVVLTVGKMEPFRPEDGLKIKADGLIVKPFEAGNLISIVEKLAERLHGPTPSLPNTIVPAIGGPGYHPPKSATAELLSPSKLAARLQEATPVAPPPAARCQPAAEVIPQPVPSTAAPASDRRNPSSGPQDGEICDVCGHLNSADAFACAQCDVPLPSSVKGFRGAGKTS